MNPPQVRLMRNRTEVQIACSAQDAPSASEIDDWIRSTLDSVSRRGVEVTVRVVDEAEIVSLNRRYRDQDEATDVLAFPAGPLTHFETVPLGDVAVCAPVVNEQARRLQEPRDAHWARIVAHGVLHLCGYDHQSSDEAIRMESIEQTILVKLGLKSSRKAG